MMGLGRLNERLNNGLWHTTHPDRFLSIMDIGAILVEPPVAEEDRWFSRRFADGTQNLPVVRLMHGVSLFHFQDFDGESYSERYRLSDWREFVPHRRSWRGSVWIEIDAVAIGSSLMLPSAVREIWNSDLHRHSWMPEIEAAHIGDVPLSSIRSAFITWNEGAIVREIGLQPFDRSAYLSSLQEWRNSL